VRTVITTQTKLGERTGPCLGFEGASVFLSLEVRSYEVTSSSRDAVHRGQTQSFSLSLSRHGSRSLGQIRSSLSARSAPGRGT
jgi:hypothetical protein